MIWFLRMFSAFTDLENLSSTQANALEAEIRTHEDTKLALHEQVIGHEAERHRRISAEVMASERREEIERLITQNRELREDLARVNADRIKSVDAVNVKLMRDSVPEVLPDMEKYKLPVKDRQSMKPSQLNNQAAIGLLRQHHPQFMVQVEEPVTSPIDEVNV